MFLLLPIFCCYFFFIYLFVTAKAALPKIVLKKLRGLGSETSKSINKLIGSTKWLWIFTIAGFTTWGQISSSKLGGEEEPKDISLSMIKRSLENNADIRPKSTHHKRNRFSNYYFQIHIHMLISRRICDGNVQAVLSHFLPIVWIRSPLLSGSESRWSGPSQVYLTLKVRRQEAVKGPCGIYVNCTK